MVRRKSDVDSVETEEVEVSTPVVRGDLPEGFMTPSDFAYHVTTLEIYTDRKGRHLVLPQMVYSGAKSKKNPFPLEVVEDSNGNEVKAVNVEKGIEWFNSKNENKARIASGVKPAKSNLDKLKARVENAKALIEKLEKQIENGGEPYTDDEGNVVDMIIRGRGRKPKNAVVVEDEDSE